MSPLPAGCPAWAGAARLQAMGRSGEGSPMSQGFHIRASEGVKRTKAERQFWPSVVLPGKSTVGRRLESARRTVGQGVCEVVRATLKLRLGVLNFPRNGRQAGAGMRTSEIR